MKAELVKTERMDLSAEDQASSGALGMIERLITKGVTADNVAALKELRAMHIDEEDRDAKRQFNAAFVALQAELPAIHPIKEVKGNNGALMYCYAPYEEIMARIAPLLTKHGFAVAFTTKYTDNRAVAVCTLMHSAGHEKTNEYAVRAGGGQSWLTDAQRDGSAMTYAQRGALCDCFNIVVTGRDNDAREIGAVVTPDQAEDLRQRVGDTGSNEAAFLKFAGGATFDTIPANRYKELDTFLKRKEGRA